MSIISHGQLPPLPWAPAVAHYRAFVWEVQDGAQSRKLLNHTGFAAGHVCVCVCVKPISLEAAVDCRGHLNEDG